VKVADGEFPVAKVIEATIALVPYSRDARFDQSCKLSGTLDRMARIA